MELPEETIRGLSSLQDSSAVSEEAFQQILETAVAAVSGNDVGRKSSPKACDSKPLLLKSSVASVACLLAEAARRDADEESLLNFLQSVNLTGKRTKRICEVYAEAKKAVQTQLETVGRNPPHVVDVDWRLDYCVKLDTCNSVGVPLYHVRLSTLDGRAEGDVTFACTAQQLQDLVSKLKDATRHLEKLTSV